MKKNRRVIFYLAIAIALSLCTVAGAWHTSPDKWSAPRYFHEDFDASYSNRIKVSHAKSKEQGEFVYFSSNKAYWYSYEASPASGECDSSIMIYNEKDYLVEIQMKKRYCNYEMEINWINEKLVFIRVWWGRVLGTDLIFDVEKEIFIHKEMVNDGVDAYEQFLEAKEKQ